MSSKVTVGAAYHWRDGWYFSVDEQDGSIIIQAHQDSHYNSDQLKEARIPPEEWVSILRHLDEIRAAQGSARELASGATPGATPGAWDSGQRDRRLSYP